LSDRAKIATLKKKLRRLERIRMGTIQFFIPAMIMFGIYVWQNVQVGIQWGIDGSSFIYAYILVGLIGGFAVFTVYVYCKRLEAQVKREMEQLAKGRKYLL
jgi:hypothetical protein